MRNRAAILSAMSLMGVMMADLPAVPHEASSAEPPKRPKPPRHGYIERVTRGEVVGGKETPIRNDNKTGRNEPCPCGSGTKQKKCCGR